MSYRTQTSTAISWLLHKTYASVRENIGSIEGYRVPFSERRAILVAADGFCVLVATWIAFLVWGWVHFGEFRLITEHIQSSWYWFVALPFSWWVLAWLNDLYDIPSSYHSSQNLIRILIVAGLAFFVYSLIYFAAPTDALPRIFLLTFLIFASLFVCIWRITYVRLSEVLPFSHRVLIVGLGNRAHTIAAALDLSPGLNYEIIGYVDAGVPATFPDNYSAHGNLAHQVPDEPTITLYDPAAILGSISQLPALVEKHNVHEIIIALEEHLERNIFDSLVDCQAKGVYVSWMPNLYEQLLRRVPVQHIDPAWALQATSVQPALGRIQLTLKRLLDITMMLLVLPTVLIIIPLVAFAIWLDTGGPIFYRQTRSGRADKPFSIYKFRTMTTNAEENGMAQWAMPNDARITRVGRFLRRTRLDELPQVFNILRGDMSVVGPRPERPEFVQKLQEEIPYYRARLMMKPGLTGWAQVHYRYGSSSEDAEMKLQYDFYYIRYWSIWLDFYTIFRTFGVVLRLEGI